MMTQQRLNSVPVYNLRKLTHHGLTIPQVCSGLMPKNFLIPMLYTFIDILSVY